MIVGYYGMMNDISLLFSNYTRAEENLIPILQSLQGEEGYISIEGVRLTSQYLKISENQIYGVASFYTQFRFTKPGRNIIKVCQGTACHVRGGRLLVEEVERELGIRPGQVTEDCRYDFQRVACLGCCALAPVVLINDDIHERMTVSLLKKTLQQYE
jgi:NADH-quinone oxidoreductase subunit E